MLQGKTAVITGSTSGIGLGIAEGLAAQGCNIVLNGYEPPEEVEPVRARVAEACSAKVSLFTGDLTKVEVCEALIDHAIAEHGSADILVNNAGIQHVAKLEEFPVAKWDMILALNLSSAFHTCRKALPAMKSAGWGRVVNIASAHGLIASPFKSAYVAAKHGLVGMTKVMALETAETGITCNTICPGYVLTPLVEKQIADQAKTHGIPEDEVIRDVILKSQPNKEFTTTEDIAALTVFLCSEAAKTITGTSLSIDGGWTAQ
ncbi:MAG: 3-hydroxybutyrate dehydrogenase [Pseudomonadota bacterium]